MRSSSATLMPGVGMCAPTRYTINRARVNNTRFRKSSMRKMFLTASTNRFIRVPCRFSLRYDLKRAARLGNLFLGRSAERVRVNGELVLQFAVAENLDAIRGAADKSMCAKQLRSDRFTRRKNIQFFQVHHRIRDAKRIVETALRDAAVQRHLPAFKSAAARIAAAGLLTLVAGARSFAEFRADAAAHADLANARAQGRMQIRERKCAALFRCRSCRLVLAAFARTACSLFRHSLTPPLPRDAAPCESCRERPECPDARRPGANAAGRGRGWSGACHRCSR